MRAPAPGEAVLDLPWLAPGADALLALARLAPAGAWSVARHDPGAVLLAVRYGCPCSSPDKAFAPADLSDPCLLEAAHRHLSESPGRGSADWSRPEIAPVLGAALRYARYSRRIAGMTGRCDPEHAGMAGLLAPLGWLAMSAADPGAVRAALAEPDHGRRPGAAEKRLWGYDAAALARRLARRWHLPPWLTPVCGGLGLPAGTLPSSAANTDLFLTVQLAVALAQRHGAGLGLAVGTPPADAAAALGLPPGAADTFIDEENPDGAKNATGPSRGAAEVPLLADVLRLTAENRRLREGPSPRRLEDELDALHDALRGARAGEAERLRTEKLNSLAEFAAGAGHEINNPLAVISGQAQFLLNKLRPTRARLVAEETNGHNGAAPADLLAVPALHGPDVEVALRKIVEQAQRIHHLLRELMQFARPPRPEARALDLGALVREVAASLGELAAQRRVRLLGPPPSQVVPVHADSSQVRTAVACLLRNAVEAAPADGWAAVRLEAPSPDRVEVVVEDNGAGPPPQQREHLFDPFYSGRAAGRGRGLGLPTAWRLANLHGGDVRFVPLPDGPTRFVLSLVAHAPAPLQEPPAPTRNGVVH